MQRVTLLALATVLSSISVASVVTKVSSSGKGALISQDTTPFKSGDRVCLYAPGRDKPHACGNVTQANDKAAIIAIDRSTAAPVVGNLARLSRVANSESSQSRTSQTRTSRVAISRQSYSDNKFSLGIGPIGNWNFFIASMHLQFAASHNFAVGLLPFYVSSGSVNKVKDMGAFLTFNYYNGPGAFSGLWISGGGGFHKLTLEGPDDDGVTLLTESATALSFFGTVGYRLRFGDTFQAGISGGALYTKESTTIFTLSFNGVAPIFLADVGVTF